MLKLLPVLLSASSRIRLAKSDLPVDKLMIFEYSRWIIDKKLLLMEALEVLKILTKLFKNASSSSSEKVVGSL